MVRPKFPKGKEPDDPHFDDPEPVDPENPDEEDVIWLVGDEAPAEPEALKKKEEEEIREILARREKEFKERYGVEVQRRQEEEEKALDIKFDMKPREVKEQLDRDVIGQEKAKKYLANAICYHYARVKRDREDEKRRAAGEKIKDGSDTSVKKNVLLIGNTGVGKTFMVSKISKIVGVPFVKEDATKFSEIGYVGRNVENMVVDLYFAANRNARLAQYGIVYVDEIDKIRSVQGYGRDVSGVGVQRGLLNLMEESEVDILSSMDLGAQMQEYRDPRIAVDGKRPVINTKNILFIMAGAFPGLEDIVRRRGALPIQNTEKGADVESAEKVAEKYPMPGLVKLLEEGKGGGSSGPSASIDISGASGAGPGSGSEEWVEVITSKDLVDYGFEPEFVGRIPVRVGLHDLSEEHLYHILKNSGDSIIKQYVKDFFAYGIVAGFTDDALRAIASRAANQDMGARALTKIVEDTLFEFLYELPSTEIKELNIDQSLVERPREALVDLLIRPETDRYRSDARAQHGIRINFEQASFSAIKNMAIANGMMPRDICKALLDKYIPVLTASGRRTFNVTEEMVKEPGKAYAEFTQKYGKKEE